MFLSQSERDVAILLAVSGNVVCNALPLLILSDHDMLEWLPLGREVFHHRHFLS